MATRLDSAGAARALLDAIERETDTKGLHSLCQPWVDVGPTRTGGGGSVVAALSAAIERQPDAGARDWWLALAAVSDRIETVQAMKVTHRAILALSRANPFEGNGSPALLFQRGMRRLMSNDSIPNERLVAREMAARLIAKPSTTVTPCWPSSSTTAGSDSSNGPTNSP